MASTHDSPAPPVIRGEFERWEQAHYMTKTQDPITRRWATFCPPHGGWPAGLPSSFLDGHRGDELQYVVIAFDKVV